MQTTIYANAAHSDTHLACISTRVVQLNRHKTDCATK